MEADFRCLPVVLTPEDVARERLHPVEKELSVQVIDLVLQRTGLETARLDCLRLPGARQSLDDDLGRAPNVGGEVGNAQATLSCDLGSGRKHDAGVDEQYLPGAGIALGVERDVNDDDANRLADLGSRQAYAARKAVHRLDEIVGDPFDPLPLFRRSLHRQPLQNRVGKMEDPSNSHVREFLPDRALVTTIRVPK